MQTTKACRALPRRGQGRRVHPALLALGAMLLSPGLGFADDQTVTGTSQTGYPRTSDTVPPGPDAAQDGDGEENDPGGTCYDTNFWFDGGIGDTDIVWMKVRMACIQGYGQVEDADVSSATSRAKSAWGEDRVHFEVAATSNDQVSIVVTNRIRITGSWILNGNGRNSAALKAQAMDINGVVHTVARTLTVDPQATSTTTTSEGETSTDSESTNVGTQAGQPGVGASHTETQTSGDQYQHATSVTVTTAGGISGCADVPWTIVRSYSGTSCDVKIGSTELIDIQAQAAVDGVQTTVKIAYFDTVNLVEACYVIDSPTSGPGSPGGNDNGGPGTPGGGGTPGGPGDPGGGTPSGPETPGGGTPPGGGPPGGGDPPEPEDEPEEPPAPVPPGGGSAPQSPEDPDGGAPEPPPEPPPPGAPPPPAAPL